MNNTEKIIDSRDIIERISELTDLKEAVEQAQEDLNDAGPEFREECQEALGAAQDEFDDDAQAELVAMEDGYGDWKHGETLIHEDYFTEYAKQFAEDVGAISEYWPCNHIDWEAAADALLMDYTAVDFGGETYYLNFRRFPSMKSRAFRGYLELEATRPFDLTSGN